MAVQINILNFEVFKRHLKIGNSFVCVPTVFDR